MANTICGVDVSSTSLDARIGHADGPYRRFDRSAEGIAALADFCRDHGVDLVVMEATGGYEQLPFGLLWAQGIGAAIVNPRAVRRFAEAMGLLEKTDRIDAGVIAWYAAVKRISPRAPASQTQQQLAAWVSRLRQLVDLRVSQSNQRRLLSEPDVLASIDEIIATINRQIRAFEVRIAALIAGDPLWRKLDAAFRSIKGVADRTVGLAPIARDSGKRSGKRPVRGGRAGVRSVLFVVAELVRRHDPAFAAFSKRLAGAGKPKKVIRVALAHKLLTKLNAKARDVRAELALAS